MCKGACKQASKQASKQGHLGSARVFVKQGLLAEQPHSASLTRRVFPKSICVFCAWSSEGRLLKELQQVGQDVRDLRTEVRVLEARVNSAVTVHVGAYLALVLGFAALANNLGYLDKLKH